MSPRKAAKVTNQGGARAGAGRKPEGPEARRHPITIRFTGPEIATITAAAKNEGQSSAAFVREAAIEYAAQVLEHAREIDNNG